MRLLVLASALILAAGCGSQAPSPSGSPFREPAVRLQARPGATGNAGCRPGQHELRIAPDRRALMLVTRPDAARPRRAVLLALHGAGSGGAPGGLHAFRSAWDLPGLVLVAPAAAGGWWTLDARDIGFVDRALQRAFARCRVDARRVAVGGFSSGAGLAVWLGLANGDLFSHVVVLSGGGGLPSRRVGTPRVLVAHGARDRVIPAARGGDALVAALRELGYAVTYRRFAGGHRPDPDIVRAFVRRAAASR
jgi:phospholipase/carboxylesterase